MEPEQQNAEGPGTVPAPQQIDQALDGVHQADPKLLADLNARLGVPQQPNQKSAAAGQKSGLWDRLKQSVSNAGITLDTEASKKEGLAVARGVTKGVDAISNTVVGAAVGISKKTGVYKVGRSQQEQDAFLKWWDQPTNKANPIQFGDERVNKWFGPQQGGWAGFAEGAAQFATGMVAASKLISAPGALATVAKGALADMTAFDPHQKRLSNMVEENSPAWMHNRVTAFLSSSNSDSEALSRVKAGLEGILTNGTIEAFSYGLKAIKALKAGDTAGAATAQQQAVEAASKPAAGDVVGVKKTPDGTFAVAPNGNLNIRRKVATLLDPTLEQDRRAAVREADTHPLTGVANQRAWKRALPAAEADPNTAVIRFDANGFKNVNDVLSHDAGDEALKHIASTLTDVAEQHGIGGRVFHIGGDEFGVLAPTQKAETIRDAMEQAYGVQNYGSNGKSARTSISGAIGQTNAEADALTKARKVEHKRVQGISTSRDVKPIVPEPNPHDPAQTDLFADAPTFHSQGEAESFAASVNYAHTNNAMPSGVIPPVDVEAWKKALAGYRAGTDPRTTAELLESYGVNVKYAQAPEDVVNHLKALVDVMPEPSTVARDRPRTFAEVAADADKMEFAGMSGDEAVSAARRIFGSTDNLDAGLHAMRTWEWMHAKQIQKLARMAELDPENPIAHDQLASALDTLLEFHAYRTGTSSNVARGLNAHKMPVGGEALADGEKAAAKEGVTDEAVQAEAQATGTEQTGTVEEDGAEKGAPKAPKPAAPAEPAPGGMEGAQAGPAQTASSNAGAASPLTWKAPAGRKATEGLTRSQVRALARTVFMTDGDPGAILKALRGPKGSPPSGVNPKTWFEAINSFRMEAMLSGPKTQVTNFVNNAIAMLQRPSEYYWAGMRSGNAALRQQGADMFGGMLHSMGESWQAARKAFLAGDNLLDPSNSHTGSTLPAWNDTGWIGRLANAPSRFLMSADEFSKQMNYRVNLRSQILRQARDQGITDSKELAERLTADMQFAFDPNGGAVNPLALEYARVGTFTNELGADTMGGGIQAFVQKHPMARFVLPFVRTPVNIFRYAWERTPGLNRFSETMRADLAAGGERAAIAHAKSELGGAVWSTAAGLVATGNLTGAGPSDPILRKQWKEAGHQPYSINLPGLGWVSYRRLDPFGAPLGLVSDAVQIMTDLSHRGETWEHIPAAVIASVASNVSSKTFMQSITEFMDAVSSGNGHTAEKFLKASAASFIPNVLRQANPDDTVHETRGFIDEMLARVPGFSNTLEPKRNLFGEKVLLPPGYMNRSLNPFTLAGPTQDGNVADELIKLGRGMTMPAETKENGLIKLTDRDLYDNGNGKRQSPYDRMLELIGNPPDGQPTLRKQLTDLVNSDAWTRIAGDNSIQPGGMKWQLAQTIINSAQQAAWGRVLAEYPKLQVALGQSAELKGRAMGGGQAAVDSTVQKYTDLFVVPSRGSRK